MCRIRYHIFYYALFGFMLFLPKYGYAIEVCIGDTNISIPSLKGFTDVSTVSQDALLAFRDCCPPTNRLVATFVTTADAKRLLIGDAAEFDRYIMVQSVIDLEKTKVTEHQFSEVRTILRKEYDSIFEKMDIKEILKNISEKISDRNKANIALKMKGFIPLGIDSETPTSLAMSQLSRYNVSVKGEQPEYIVAVTLVTLLVKEKIFYIGVCSKYKTDSDLAWTRSTAQTLTEKIIAANKTVGKPAGFPIAIYNEKKPGLFERLRDTVVETTFIFLIIAGFYVISSFLKRKQTSCKKCRFGMVIPDSEEIKCQIRGYDYPQTYSCPQAEPQRVESQGQIAEPYSESDLFNMGVKYADGQDVDQNFFEAAKCFFKASEQGRSSEAQVRLGVMFAKGQGVKQDDTEAVKWFRKAAEQGDAIGQVSLGWMYSKGEGVAQDYAQAAKWYRKAAEQGEPAAQYNLSGMYADGEGVKKDYVEAYKWVLLAGKNGKDVDNEKRVLNGKLSEQQIEEAEKRVKAFEAKNSKEK